MKTILTTFAFCFCCLIATAGISPSATAEYCPLTEYVFNVDYSGEMSFHSFSAATNTYGRVITGNYNSTTNVTTFTFGITFNDIIATHDLTIKYSTYTGPDQYETFTFTKIKSLFGDTRLVNPGISTITAPYCVSTTTNISFSNLAWTGLGSSTFGAILQYDYSVPAGWSVDGSVSSGPSDIKHGSNSATIVSDGVNGGYVYITPVNTACNVNAFHGNTLAIAIIRPQPGTTFTGASTICSSENYTASNIPSWVTDILWEVTSSSLVTSGSSTSNPATFTKATDGVGAIKFTISNPGCGLSFSYNTTQITGNTNLIVGSPKPTAIYKESEYCIGGSDWEATFRAYPNVGGISYNWKYNGSLVTYNHDSYFYTYEFPADCITLDVQLVSGCGVSSWLSADYLGNPATFCPSCFGYRMAISPNPTSNQITITSKSVKNPLNIKEVRLVDGQGVVRKSVKANGVRQLKIDISTLPVGKYFVNVFDGKEWLSQLIIKN